MLVEPLTLPCVPLVLPLTLPCWPLVVPLTLPCWPLVLPLTLPCVPVSVLAVEPLVPMLPEAVVELLEGWLLTEPCALVSAGTGLFAADVLLCAVVPALAVACVPLAPPRDRKSTRLNSSHVASSYAVFCLKKTVKYTDSPPSPNRA